ncbi:MAG TPA: hypothetical protein VJ831_07770 [Jatrophihabitantaceae bacterium]|nr:hypothetical protein [Jatrophihabitantaceae bacterium]
MAILGAILIFGLIAMFIGVAVWDRRTRRRGHRLRSSSEIWRAEQDVHRNLRANQEYGGNPNDMQWGTPDEQRYGQSRWERGD